MSATAPYVLNKETSPSRLRLFIARHPEAMSVFRNVLNGDPLGYKVFVDGSTSAVLSDDDTTLEFLIDKLIQFSFLTRNENKIETAYSDIIIRSDSFTPEEHQIYAYNVARQTMIALRCEGEKVATVLYFVGSLQKEDFAGMTEGVSAVQDRYRDRPNGEISYITSFICKQIQ